MTTRQDIADALTVAAIPGITAFPRKPNSLSKGMAWPKVTGHTREDGFFSTSWAIYVVAPKGEALAEDWYDANIDALREALRPVVYVDGDEPIFLSTTDTDPAFGIQISARSE